MYEVKGQFSIVEDGATIGDGTIIWHRVLVRSGAVIGANCVIGSGVEVGPGTHIGDGTHVGCGVQAHHPAQVGSRVFLGPNAFLSNDKYPMVGKDFVPQGVTIGDDAIICAGAMIVGGVSVGEGAVVAMAAVVTRDVPEGVMVRGVPAKEYGRRGLCYPGTAMQHWAPLGDDNSCVECRRRGLADYRTWMREHGND